LATRQPFLQAAHDLFPEQSPGRHSQTIFDRHRKVFLNIRADLFDAGQVPVQVDQHTKGLNGSGDMDRLVLAGRQGGIYFGLGVY